MSNMIDYIDWRGDIPLSASPFNEIDNLLFAELSYINFKHVIPEAPKYGWVTLAETMRTYMSLHRGEKEKLGLIMPDDYLEMARRMALSRRFSEMKLTGYVRYLDTAREEQFSALTVDLLDGTYLIVYSGTDDSVIGWKEDLNLAFLASIPAQDDAADYLELMAEALPGDLRVSGHSKGGNLAMYAAAKNSSKYSDRIIRVYNNDGPGFLEGMIESQGYRAIRDRIITITPQTSIVGSLLYNTARQLIVKSTVKIGIGQHDAYSWQVLGSRFVEVPEGRTGESLRFDSMMKSWLSGMTPKDREDMTEIVYKLLGAGEKRTLTELGGDKTAIIKAYRKLSDEEKSIAKKHLKSLIAAGGESILQSIGLARAGNRLK